MVLGKILEKNGAWPRIVAEAKGRIWRRKDGKYFLYLPRHLVEDSAFPFKTESSISVKVIIDRQGRPQLVQVARSGWIGGANLCEGSQRKRSSEPGIALKLL